MGRGVDRKAPRGEQLQDGLGTPVQTPLRQALFQSFLPALYPALYPALFSSPRQPLLASPFDEFLAIAPHQFLRALLIQYRM
jgi:hypothetical protein